MKSYVSKANKKYFLSHTHTLKTRFCPTHAWKLLIEKGMSKTDLRVKAEMSTSTLAKMGKNEIVSMNVIMKICEILDCNVSDVMTVDKISE